LNGWSYLFIFLDQTERRFFPEGTCLKLFKKLVRTELRRSNKEVFRDARDTEGEFLSIHFGEIHGLNLGQAGKNFPVYLGARLFEPGDDDLPERLELVGRKSSDFQVFKVGGKNSGDSWCDSFLWHHEKEKTSWNEISECMLEEGKLCPAVCRIEVIRRIQIQN